MTYPCLVLDHDDTVVNSTATVHYPCFAEYTAKFFPKAKRYTLEEYVLKNFDPGVYDFFHGEVGMTEEDMKHEQAYWHEYVQHHVPQVYDGMRDILWDYVHAAARSASYRTRSRRTFCATTAKISSPSRSSSTAGRCQRTGASPSRTRSMISWKSSASPPSRCSCSTT